MLTKDVFKQQMEILIATYPTWGIKCEDPNVMQVWYSMFEQYSDYRFKYAVTMFVQHEKFNPTVAVLTDYLSKTSDPVELKFVKTMRVSE